MIASQKETKNHSDKQKTQDIKKQRNKRDKGGLDFEKKRQETDKKAK